MSKLQILKIKSAGAMPIITPAKPNHKKIFTIIPLVIGLQICRRGDFADICLIIFSKETHRP